MARLAKCSIFFFSVSKYFVFKKTFSFRFCLSPILENWDDLFEIKPSSDFNLQLVSKNDLPPDYVSDPADSQYENDIHSSTSSYGKFNFVGISEIIRKS